MQSKLHLLHPSLFLAPQTCQPQQPLASRSWQAWGSAEPQDPAEGAVAHAPTTSAPLQHGRGAVRQMRNLERLVLRPINVRGHSAAQVQAPRTDAEVQAELAGEAGDAIATCKGAHACDLLPHGARLPARAVYAAL